MRNQGVLRTVDELGPCDHACWLYEDRNQLRSEGTRFLEDGLRLGQRLLYVGPAPAGELHSQLREGLPQCDELIDAGALHVSSLSERYERPSQIAPERQLARFIDTTAQAIADGYRGLRVLADVAALISDEADRAARAHTEHLAERFMAAGNPMSALCCYDAKALDADALSHVACVHPLVRGEHVEHGFRLYGDGAQLCLAGEIDHFNTPLLERALASVDTATIDLGELEFIDHRGLLALARRRREVNETGGTLRFTSIPTVARTTLELLGESLRDDDFAQPPVCG